MEILVTEAHQQSGRIALCVPTNHLNGALWMEMKYKFGAPGFANHVRGVEVTPYYQKQGEVAKTADLVPTPTIVHGMKLACDYFAYAFEHLDGKNEKTHPLSFSEWVKGVKIPA